MLRPHIVQLETQSTDKNGTHYDDDGDDGNNDGNDDGDYDDIDDINDGDDIG